MTAISCKPFFDDRTFLFCFQVVFFLATVAKLRLETLPRDVFLWLASFLRVDLLRIRIENG